MQTFLKSCTRLFGTRHILSRGFTLIELLVSLAIITIITSTVLVRYDKFDSTILLKSAAYDVALALRDVQIRSVSGVHGNSNVAKYPYGVTFTPAGGTETGKEYVMFRYKDISAYPSYDGTGLVEDLLKTKIDRTMYVSDVCITVGGASDCTISRLDISFRRPEFKALFHAAGFTGSMSDIQSATIRLMSPKGTENFEIIVSQLGQITVKKM